MANYDMASIALESAKDEMENMYLNFDVGREVYGIEIRHILQIIGMQEITEMPEMPPCMKGFINLRSDVIPVVSMRLRFGKHEEKYSERTCIIVVQIGERRTGLVVDSIRETTSIEPKSISPPPNTDEQTEIPYITGIARMPHGDTVTLINVRKLFDGEGRK